MSKDKFLKDSKVKDVHYHGTMHDNDHGKVRNKMLSDGGIREFRPGDHHLLFATPDKDFANSYAYAGSEKLPYPAAVYPLHVHAKNPFDYENEEHRENLIDKMLPHPKHNYDERQDMRRRLQSGDWGYIERPDVIEAAKKLGHDAMYMKEGGAKNIGVFNPNQFKSSIGNNGNYDMNDPDITKAKGGTISTEQMRKELAQKKHTTKKVGGIVRKSIGGSMANPYLMDGIGANDASDMNPKMFINPDPSQRSAGNVGGTGGMPELPVGGAQIQPPPQQGGLPQSQGNGAPPQITPQQPQQPMGNMLNQTPQGRLMQNMQAQPMKKGGVVKHTHEIIHSKTGKVVGKFGSLKEARVHHAGMDKHEEHAIQPVKKMAKSIDLMKVEMLIKKGKK